MYQALYREFRPMKFEDSVGQESIAKILKNQIEQNKTSHAYLFTGVRGTGKTSFAKIFARAVNCLDLKDGEPCNKCENCLAILKNDTTDVIEMDAASNTSVDDIRKIIEEMYFVPAKLKYRVYIIDEAHMLSNSAWNAFLKSLEEPPEHVKFVLATTEPQKLLPTILSRCQRFDFKKIDEKTIYKYLAKISKESKIEIKEDSLRLIANLADGSMRDGISILESLRAFNKNISVEDIRSVVGIPSLDDIIVLLKNIIEQKEQDVLSFSYKLINEGKEANNILVELLKVLESIVINSKEDLIKYTDSEQKLINEIKLIPGLNLYNLIKDLSQIYADLKYANNKNTIFIASMLALTNREYKKLNINTSVGVNVNNNIESLKNEPKHINKIEQKEIIRELQEEKRKEIEKEIKKTPSVTNLNRNNQEKNNLDWAEVMKNISDKKEMRLFVNLVQARTQILGEAVEIKIDKKLTDTDKEYLNSKETIDKIKDAIEEETGNQYNIELIYKKED